MQIFQRFAKDPGDAIRQARSRIRTAIGFIKRGNNDQALKVLEVTKKDLDAIRIQGPLTKGR